MRVLLISCVFPPEPVVSAQTSAQIARELVCRGHEVTVVAPFPNRPRGELYPGYARVLFRRQRSGEGYEIVRCFSTLSCESSMPSRFLENLSFGLTGGWAALTAARPDVMYTNTWPIFATGILWLVSKIRRIPLVISVQDVYPESLVSQGRTLANSPIARVMRWLDGLIARGARDVIVISKRFAAIYQNGRRVDPARVHVIPNWGEPGSSSPDSQPGCFREAKRNSGGAFLITYGGNVGVASGVETVIKALGHLNGEQDVRLVVAGEGSRLAACRTLAGEMGEDRILFHSPWPVEETWPVLRGADVLVLPTLGCQSLASVPSKLISYMLAARPVIALALPESDVAEMMERSGAGWTIEPDQPELLAAQISQVATMDASELMRRGQAGREFALKHLTREACLPRVIHILERAAT